MDALPIPDAGGYHLDEHGQPLARILWSPTWSLSASHEVLEMLVDPFGSQIATGVSVMNPGERVKYLVEVCDPCESLDCSYKINTGLTGFEVIVSDFYTPDYFASSVVPGARYSFTGSLTLPRQVTNGGYLSWQSSNGHIWQLFGPAALGNFQDHGRGKLTREKSDSHARTLRAAAAVAPTPGCKLGVDTLNGVFTGTIGDQVDLAINGTSDAASFFDVNYAGASVGGAGKTTVTITIVAGNQEVRCIVSARPGDTVELKESPCGQLLDSVIFRADPGTLDVIHIVGS
jgi:hypothetical protein